MVSMADNTQEILRSAEGNQPKIVDEDINTLPASPSPTPLNHNNNHHVVPAGIFIVLFTLYLSTTALHRSYEAKIEAEISRLSPKITIEAEKISTDLRQNSLHESVDHENVCQTWEIFTTTMPRTVNLEEHLADKIIPENDVNKPGFGEFKRSHVSSKKARRRKLINHKKTKKSLQKKASNAHNRSARAKEQKRQDDSKKDIQGKKSTTAEPIIYLFALVFIYLLVKAASDINQHYKSEAKGDKRLRRCSLQSYAQQHKQDRRASKGISSKNLPKF